MLRYKTALLALCVLAIAGGFAQATDAYWMTCNNCGFFGDSCGYGIAPDSIQTGYAYDLKMTAERVCANCGATVTATVNLSSQETNKYSLSGGINASYFNLSGGWENEKTTVSSCTLSEQSAPGGCAGPLYAYFKYSYTEKYLGYHNYTYGKWCRTCTGNGATGVLKQEPVGVCTGTSYASFVPALYTEAAFCASCGEN